MRRAAYIAGSKAGLACLMLAAAAPAGAKVPEVRVTADADLRFGRFMVFGSGTRTVSASGAVSDVAIVALEGSSTGPASFTVSYDRGNESRHVIDLEFDVVFTVPPRVRDAGIEGNLSAFETDLPGATRVAPGQAIRIAIPNCRTRVCSRSFNVGARLEVTRHFGGARLAIPIPVDVVVIEAERQAR